MKSGSQSAPVRPFLEALGLACIDAKRFIVHRHYFHKVRTVFFIEICEVLAVLEIVRVQLAVLDRGVGQHIVVEFHDLQRVAFLGKQFLGHAQDLRMRRHACAHLDRDRFLHLRTPGHLVFLLLAAAGRQANQQAERQDKCCKFFHTNHLL